MLSQVRSGQFRLGQVGSGYVTLVQVRPYNTGYVRSGHDISG
jgi:hypothetical protein